MSDHIARSHFFTRVFEMTVPLLSWLIITLPLWMSPFHPAVVAYLIITFDLYFLYKSVVTAYFATISFNKITLMAKVSFIHKLQKMQKRKEILHFVIIPNYKEPYYKLESTVTAISKNDFEKKQIYLVLAFEKREQEAVEKAEKLKTKFNNTFAGIIEAYHELVFSETPGKASNQSFAAQAVETYIEKKGIKPEHVIITICDADSHLPINYFSYLTYEYLRDKDRLYHFYWAPVLLYNNFWQLPFFVRMQATLSSILRLAFLSQTDKLIQISTYSTSLWLLKEVHFWDVDIIPEDWHIYFQAFFTFGERVKTIPLYTMINGDAVYSGTLIKTLLNRYEQEKRWAWGVSDVGYALKKLFTTPTISIYAKFKKLIFLIETHLFWPTSFFILTISASIPPLINPVFKRTVLGFLLPQLSGLILTLSSAFILLYIYLDIQLRKKMNSHTHLTYLPFLIIQWYLLPAISFFLSSLPALDAHTRLLLGKKMEYKVTEKV